MATRDEIEEAAATWIARRDMGPWSEDDAAALQRWLAESVSHRAAYYRLNTAWSEAGRLRILPGESADLPAGDVSTPRPSRRLGFLALAASVLLAAIALSLWLYTQRGTYTTVVGGLQAIPMRDGSRVTLNTDSALRISVSERERVIDLDHGEAFFEVAPDPRRPFIVKAGKRRIVAVGTQFSVRREGDECRVLVSEGTVRLENADGTRSASAGSAGSGAVTKAATGELLLSAGAVARAHREDVLVQQRSPNEIEQSLTWRSGLVTFRNTPLADAVAELNRYNARKIVIEDPTIASLEVGGIFRATNLEPFVRLLEEGFALRATAAGDSIVLTRN